VSTYLYLECADHAPPLRSDDEVGQHLYDLPNVRGYFAERAHLVALVQAWEDGSDHSDTTAATIPYWVINHSPRRHVAEHRDGEPHIGFNRLVVREEECTWYSYDIKLYWRAVAAQFFFKHPYCNVIIRDETGVTHPSVEVEP